MHGGTPAAAFEDRDLLRKIVATVPPGRWDTLAWFVRVAVFGESLAEIARETGIEYAAAHQRYARLGRDLRRAAVALVAAGIALAVVLAWPRIAGRHAEGPPITADTASFEPAPPAGPSPDELLAVRLQREGLAACDATQWALCEQKLDDARRVDPAGEEDAHVKQARDAIRKWREQRRDEKAPR